MTWYRDPGITCNCTRPPVEQPDHRRRLILAPKPSSALYNTRLYTATCYAQQPPPVYITATPQYESFALVLLRILSLAHTTQDALLYSSSLLLGWHRVPELRLDSPSSGTVTTPCSWWSSHTTRRQILASRKKNRRWQGLLFKTWIS